MATSAAAAEQGAQEALGLEKLAREEAEKAREALEKRLAELEGGFASAGSEEEGAAEEEVGPALSADAILEPSICIRRFTLDRPQSHEQGELHAEISMRGGETEHAPKKQKNSGA